MRKFKKWVNRTIVDPRRSYGNKKHSLELILFIVLCTMMTKRDATYTNMADFAAAHRRWLGKFFDIRSGLPSDDTIRRVMERIDPKQLSQFLRRWLSHCVRKGSIISVDGKTIRGSGRGERKPLHIVSAFVKESHATLGDIVVEAKTNEITAVPKLLDEIAVIDLRGTIITADAMSCQKAITKKIVSKGADYVIGLKANQEKLYEMVKKRMEIGKWRAKSVVETDSKACHGRREIRTYYLLVEGDAFRDLAGLNPDKEWAGFRSIGMVEREYVDAKGTHKDTRYFIASVQDEKDFARAVREHWGIENNLHWTLDVVFREDASLAKKDNAPAALNSMRKMALYLLKGFQVKGCSMDRKMYIASMDSDFLLEMILNYTNIS